MEAALKNLPDANKRYTYEDYASWGDEVPRCEIIDGRIYYMEESEVYGMAAPTLSHQLMIANVVAQLFNFLKSKTCKVIVSPFDVRLDYDEADNIIVQPDIMVVCDPKKIENGKHCLGAPDFVVEVLSPSTSSKDHILKLARYERYGVKEYWIIDPDERAVIVHLFTEEGRDFKVYENAKKIPVHVLGGFEIDLGTDADE